MCVEKREFRGKSECVSIRLISRYSIQFYSQSVLLSSYNFFSWSANTSPKREGNILYIVLILL